MADNALKTPLNQSLNDWAKKRISSAVQLTGRRLPCTVAEVISSGIVTVNFEVDATPMTLPQVTVPVLYPEYIRYPIQVGDKGVVTAFDAYLDNIDGRGASTVPDLTKPANLSGLAFLWIGNTDWADPIDPQATEVYGPNGVNIYDTQQNTVVMVGTAGITINLSGSGTVVVNTTSGTVTITADGDVQAGTISLMNHTHSGVTTGGGDSGPPVG